MLPTVAFLNVRGLAHSWDVQIRAVASYLISYHQITFLNSVSQILPSYRHSEKNTFVTSLASRVKWDRHLLFFTLCLFHCLNSTGTHTQQSTSTRPWTALPAPVDATCVLGKFINFYDLLEANFLINCTKVTNLTRHQVCLIVFFSFFFLDSYFTSSCHTYIYY